MVRVKLYGIARDLVGKAELDVEVEREITLEDLIERITKSRGKASPTQAEVILINGRNCVFLEGLKTQIHDGDLIEILPLVRGG